MTFAALASIFLGAIAAYAQATERLSQVVDALDRGMTKELDQTTTMDAVPAISNTSPAEYLSMVARAKIWKCSFNWKSACQPTEPCNESIF